MSSTVIEGSQIRVGTITDSQVASGNKDGIATVPSMRTLGSASQQACAGNDSRLFFPGFIIPYPGWIAPSGWLFCNGAQASRTSYAGLYGAIVTTIQATFTNGSASVTLIGFTTGQFYIGMKLECPSGISTGAVTVAAVTGSYTITMSAPATASGTFTMYAFPHGNGDGSTTFNLPDLIGRVLMGNDYAGVRLAVNKPAIGQSGGEEQHTLSVAEMPSHIHPVVDPKHVHGYTNGAGDLFGGVASGGSGAFTAGNSVVGTQLVSASTGITVSSAGSGTAHNNLPPYLAINYIIKA